MISLLQICQHLCHLIIVLCLTFNVHGTYVQINTQKSFILYICVLICTIDLCLNVMPPQSIDLDKFDQTCSSPVTSLYLSHEAIVLFALEENV